MSRTYHVRLRKEEIEWVGSQFHRVHNLFGLTIPAKQKPVDWFPYSSPIATPHETTWENLKKHWWPRFYNWVARTAAWQVYRWCDLSRARADSACGEKLTYCNPDFVRVDEEKVLDVLHNARLDLERIWREEAKYVLLGRDCFRALMIETDVMFAQFPVDMRISHGNYQDPVCRVFGLTVCLVPWMEGIVLVPDLKVFARSCP